MTHFRHNNVFSDDVTAYKLIKCNDNYKFTNSLENINPLMYMNYIKIYENEKEILGILLR